MKTAAIVLDTYKLDTFKKTLKAHGYDFTVHPGITPDTTTLKIQFYDRELEQVTALVEKMNNEATKDNG
jgi:5,10-methylenetetrahydrofolate reductase